jgi:hypothetical protein
MMMNLDMRRLVRISGMAGLIMNGLQQMESGNFEIRYANLRSHI